MVRLTDDERVWRAQGLRDWFLPELREAYPLGTVVIVNLATGAFVVGEHELDTIERYRAEIGRWPHDNAWMEPVHEHDPRSIDERVASVIAWLGRRKLVESLLTGGRRGGRRRAS